LLASRHIICKSWLVFCNDGLFWLFAALSGRDHISGAEVLNSEEEGEREEGEDGWETASDTDDDSDGEWIDVHHSSDEDVQVNTAGGW